MAKIFVDFGIYGSISIYIYNKSCGAISINLRCSLAFKMPLSTTSAFKVATSITIIVYSSTFFATILQTKYFFFIILLPEFEL